MSASARLPPMNVALRRPMTRDEFFDWAEAQDERYEFDGFQPVAMTGGSGNHARIGHNLAFELGLRLRSGPCEPLGGDAGIATIGDRVRYPDALVTCTTFGGHDRIVPEPVIVVEVISATSGRMDRIVKVGEYHAVPSIQRYVIVERTYMGVTVLWRTAADQPWSTLTLAEGDTLLLPEVGIEIPVVDLYARVMFGDAGTAASDV
jgi:Uma2 family endonuclease